MAARHRLMHQYIRETFPSFLVKDIPSRITLMRVWREWFGSGGARARYARSAEDAEDADVGRRLIVHRPGQVIALDSTPLPVKLRESVFGEAVSATLTHACARLVTDRACCAGEAEIRVDGALHQPRRRPARSGAALAG